MNTIGKERVRCTSLKGRVGQAAECGWTGTRAELTKGGYCPSCGGGAIVRDSFEPPRPPETCPFDITNASGMRRCAKPLGHSGEHALTPSAVAPVRPSWPETWMAIARTISQRSYDPRLKVGAIIVTADNTQMLSGGYNGNYAGGPHEHESTEPGLSGFIHAEINALLKLDYNHAKEKLMYLTHSPCRMCAKCIINAGIRRVVFDVAYRDPSGVDLLKSAGVAAVGIEAAIKAYESGRELDRVGAALR